MRVSLRRRARRPAGSLPAERFVAAAADEAQSLGHEHIGSEHLLLAVARRGGRAARLLADFGADERTLRAVVVDILGPCPRIDADALASLGIDLEVVRARIEDTFGPGALERAGAGCMSICPRAKEVLERAVDAAGEHPVEAEHVLLGLLQVQESLAAKVLSRWGITAAAVRSALDAAP